MTAFCLAVLAGLGTHWLVAPHRKPARSSWAGFGWFGRLRRVASNDLIITSAVFGGLGAAVAYVGFGGWPAPTAVGVLASTVPISAHRQRRQMQRGRVHDEWPALIEEIRVQTGSLGRSVPQALFEVGRRAPLELRFAFEAANREWLLTTDFARTSAVMKELLADAAVDVTMETLLVAHELATTDLDRRLAVLAEDRRQDIQGRKDARSRLAGARFARRFVLAVPAGMALAGMSIGNGRAAYHSPAGQMVVAVAVVLTALCWWWAGRIMRIPPLYRVFAEGGDR